MTDYSGLKKPELTVLPQIQARLTFVYLERCAINREDGAITVTDDVGVVYLPAAMISVLLLGPGTNISHRAIELIGDCGISLVWVGEHGVRYYASGRPLTHKSKLLLRQAAMVSNTRLHLDAVRKMYEIRFPGEDVSKLTMQQLRGKEGARVRRIYREYANQYGVEWKGRVYDVSDFASGDAVNQALSAGNVCLYGLAAAVIAAIGCSPGLGFIHVGHEMSFAYDIADLYKADITIPLAFQLAANGTPDIGNEMRRRTRDSLIENKILEKMVRDVHFILQGDKNNEQDYQTEDVLYLWNHQDDLVPGGVSYGVDGERIVLWDDSNDSDYNDQMST